MSEDDIKNIIIERINEGKKAKDIDSSYIQLSKSIDGSAHKEEIVHFLIDELLKNRHSLKYYTLGILDNLCEIDENAKWALTRNFKKAVEGESNEFIEEYLSTLLKLKVLQADNIYDTFIEKGELSRDNKFFILILYYNINKDKANLLLSKYITENIKSFKLPIDEMSFNHRMNYLLRHFKKNNLQLKDLIEGISSIDKDLSKQFESILQANGKRLRKLKLL